MTAEAFERLQEHVWDRHGLNLEDEGTVTARLSSEAIDSLTQALRSMKDLIDTASVLEGDLPTIEIRLGPGWLKDFIKGLPA